jgi:hypothetical protein
MLRAGHGLLLKSSTRHLFFTGKGGVGKTTVASATALRLAESGQRTLIVSTDPASNLDDVFAMRAGTTPTVVPGVETLSIMNLDPEAAAAAYRERMVGPYRGVLPGSAIRSMEEQLSGACTVEIAAFNEFTALLADPTLTASFDHVIFDTAPTGTRCGCSACQARGVVFSKRRAAEPVVWVRWPDSNSIARNMRRRWRRSPMLRRQQLCWWRGPM